MAHPDLPAEQRYLDQAYKCLDRMREALMQAAEAGATEVSQQAIEDWAAGRLAADEGLLALIAPASLRGDGDTTGRGPGPAGALRRGDAADP